MAVLHFVDADGHLVPVSADNPLPINGEDLGVLSDLRYSVATLEPMGGTVDEATLVAALNVESAVVYRINSLGTPLPIWVALTAIPGEVAYQPTVNNGFMYMVYGYVVTTGAEEPVWADADQFVQDGDPLTWWSYYSLQPSGLDGWLPGQAYSANFFMVDSVLGLVWQADNDGVSGPDEPDWASVPGAGSTVSDGGVFWILRGWFVGVWAPDTTIASHFINGSTLEPYVTGTAGGVNPTDLHRGQISAPAGAISGAAEPDWPLGSGASVVDGDLVWVQIGAYVPNRTILNGLGTDWPPGRHIIILNIPTSAATLRLNSVADASSNLNMTPGIGRELMFDGETWLVHNEEIIIPAND